MKMISACEGLPMTSSHNLPIQAHELNSPKLGRKKVVGGIFNATLKKYYDPVILTSVSNDVLDFYSGSIYMVMRQNETKLQGWILEWGHIKCSEYERIGRGGPVKWPARSPDRTACNFLLKDHVFAAKPQPERPEGKRPLGRPRRRWEDNIQMDLREVGYDDRDWVNLAQDRDQRRSYVRAAMNLRNIVRNENIKIGDLSFEEVEKFKYLGATVTNINDTREEIKRRINMGNACYYSAEKLLSASLLSKNLKVRIYKTVILPVVLYGCETWTLTLREEQRLRVFENKVLRKILGAKRDEVTGEWRKLHNAELHALYTSPDIIRNIKSRRLRWAGYVVCMGESRNAYRVLVGRPEGKRPLGRPRRRWEDNIKMDLREVGCNDRDDD
ncbi:hypothetical protein ANN_22900 [Periplaneta americana]|uniref:Uncharacterized protein n=1 Tax=Periplaneta americana TaxID=6978 RepID=A0ABQ8SKL6_PERAM|nr:hypothetical protein ANN_22900 [Periplaneta americana]